jgi:PTH1 family peptidyl-tRNA hydrolase
MSRIKVVIGLGNPGRGYAFTRHNLGCMLIDRLLEGIKTKDSRRRKSYHLYRVTMARRSVLLVKPRVYVNESGRAVLSLLSRERLTPETVLVACDDVALPLGRGRLRRGGSSGGHRGLRSIISVIGDGFPRLRLGVGGPGSDMVGHVLGEFSDQEESAVGEVLDAAVKAVKGTIREGLERAMNVYNRSDFWLPDK